MNLERIGKPGHIEAIVGLVNKFQEDIVNIINPHDYEGENDIFINLIITGLSMPAADMIYKLTKIYNEESMEKYEKQFIEKLHLALKWRAVR